MLYRNFSLLYNSYRAAWTTEFDLMQQWKPTLHCVADVYVFAIGAETFDDDLKSFTVGKAEEKHFFKVKGIDKMYDAFDDIIGKFVVC